MAVFGDIVHGFFDHQQEVSPEIGLNDFFIQIRSKEELDELGKKGMNGRYLTAEDYWEGNLRAAELGLRDSVRIFLVTQMDKFAANKARFNRRMVYGLGDGLNGWSVRSADVEPGADGLKTLRVIQYSARGTLFMSAWNPVGVDGFSDVYYLAIAEAV